MPFDPELQASLDQLKKSGIDPYTDPDFKESTKQLVDSGLVPPLQATSTASPGSLAPPAVQELAPRPTNGMPWASREITGAPKRPANAPRSFRQMSWPQLLAMGTDPKRKVADPTAPGGKRPHTAWDHLTEVDNDPNASDESRNWADEMKRRAGQANRLKLAQYQTGKKSWKEATDEELIAGGSVRGMNPDRLVSFIARNKGATPQEKEWSQQYRTRIRYRLKSPTIVQGMIEEGVDPKAMQAAVAQARARGEKPSVTVTFAAEKERTAAAQDAAIRKQAGEWLKWALPGTPVGGHAVALMPEQAQNEPGTRSGQKIPSKQTHTVWNPQEMREPAEPEGGYAAGLSAAKQVGYGYLTQTRPSEVPPLIWRAITQRLTNVGQAVPVKGEHWDMIEDLPAWKQGLFGLETALEGFAEPEQIAINKILAPIGMLGEAIAQGGGKGARVAGELLKHGPTAGFLVQAGVDAKKLAEEGRLPQAFGTMAAMVLPLLVSHSVPKVQRAFLHRDLRELAQNRFNLGSIEKTEARINQLDEMLGLTAMNNANNTSFSVADPATAQLMLVRLAEANSRKAKSRGGKVDETPYTIHEDYSPDTWSAVLNPDGMDALNASLALAAKDPAGAVRAAEEAIHNPSHHLDPSTAPVGRGKALPEGQVGTEPTHYVALGPDEHLPLRMVGTKWALLNDDNSVADFITPPSHVTAIDEGFVRRPLNDIFAQLKTEGNPIVEQSDYSWVHDKNGKRTVKLTPAVAEGEAIPEDVLRWMAENGVSADAAVADSLIRHGDEALSFDDLIAKAKDPALDPAVSQQLVRFYTRMRDRKITPFQLWEPRSAEDALPKAKPAPPTLDVMSPPVVEGKRIPEPTYAWYAAHDVSRDGAWMDNEVRRTSGATTPQEMIAEVNRRLRDRSVKLSVQDRKALLEVRRLHERMAVGDVKPYRSTPRTSVPQPATTPIATTPETPAPEAPVVAEPTPEAVVAPETVAPPVAETIPEARKFAPTHTIDGIPVMRVEAGKSVQYRNENGDLVVRGRRKLVPIKPEAAATPVDFSPTHELNGVLVTEKKLPYGNSTRIAYFDANGNEVKREGNQPIEIDPATGKAKTPDQIRAEGEAAHARLTDETVDKIVLAAQEAGVHPVLYFNRLDFPTASARLDRSVRDALLQRYGAPDVSAEPTPTGPLSDKQILDMVERVEAESAGSNTHPVTRFDDMMNGRGNRYGPEERQIRHALVQKHGEAPVVATEPTPPEVSAVTQDREARQARLQDTYAVGNIILQPNKEGVPTHWRVLDSKVDDLGVEITVRPVVQDEAGAWVDAPGAMAGVKRRAGAQDEVTVVARTEPAVAAPPTTTGIPLSATGIPTAKGASRIDRSAAFMVEAKKRGIPVGEDLKLGAYAEGEIRKGDDGKAEDSMTLDQMIDALTARIAEEKYRPTREQLETIKSIYESMRDERGGEGGSTAAVPPVAPTPPSGPKTDGVVPQGPDWVSKLGLLEIGPAPTNNDPKAMNEWRKRVAANKLHATLELMKLGVDAPTADLIATHLMYRGDLKGLERELTAGLAAKEAGAKNSSGISIDSYKKAIDAVARLSAESVAPTPPPTTSTPSPKRVPAKAEDVEKVLQQVPEIRPAHPVLDAAHQHLVPTFPEVRALVRRKYAENRAAGMAHEEALAHIAEKGATDETATDVRLRQLAGEGHDGTIARARKELTFELEEVASDLIPVATDRLNQSDHNFVRSMHPEAMRSATHIVNLHTSRGVQRTVARSVKQKDGSVKYSPYWPGSGWDEVAYRDTPSQDPKSRTAAWVEVLTPIPNGERSQRIVGADVLAMPDSHVEYDNATHRDSRYLVARLKDLVTGNKDDLPIEAKIAAAIEVLRKQARRQIDKDKYEQTITQLEAHIASLPDKIRLDPRTYDPFSRTLRRDIKEPAARTPRRKRAPAEKVAETATPESQEKPVVAFRTEKGSTYTVHEDGTTTRVKSYHPEHGVKDQGEQPRSRRTVYVDPKEAQRLALPEGGDWYLQISPDGISVVRISKDGTIGKPIETVAYSETPQIGMAPVELFGMITHPDGRVAYNTLHLGNKISHLSDTAIEPPAKYVPPTPVDATTPPVPQAETQPAAETAPGRPLSSTGIPSVKGSSPDSRSGAFMIEAKKRGIPTGDNLKMGAYAEGQIRAGEDGTAEDSMTLDQMIAALTDRIAKESSPQTKQQLETIRSIYESMRGEGGNTAVVPPVAPTPPPAAAPAPRRRGSQNAPALTEDDLAAARNLSEEALPTESDIRDPRSRSLYGKLLASVYPELSGTVSHTRKQADALLLSIENDLRVLKDPQSVRSSVNNARKSLTAMRDVVRAWEANQRELDTPDLDRRGRLIVEIRNGRDLSEDDFNWAMKWIPRSAEGRGNLIEYQKRGDAWEYAPYTEAGQPSHVAKAVQDGNMAHASKLMSRLAEKMQLPLLEATEHLAETSSDPGWKQAYAELAEHLKAVGHMPAKAGAESTAAPETSSEPTPVSVAPEGKEGQSETAAPVVTEAKRTAEVAPTAEVTPVVAPTATPIVEGEAPIVQRRRVATILREKKQPLSAEDKAYWDALPGKSALEQKALDGWVEKDGQWVYEKPEPVKKAAPTPKKKAPAVEAQEAKKAEAEAATPVTPEPVVSKPEAPVVPKKEAKPKATPATTALPKPGTKASEAWFRDNADDADGSLAAADAYIRKGNKAEGRVAPVTWAAIDAALKAEMASPRWAKDKAMLERFAKLRDVYAKMASTEPTPPEGGGPGKKPKTPVVKPAGRGSDAITVSDTSAPVGEVSGTMLSGDATHAKSNRTIAQLTGVIVDSEPKTKADYDRLLNMVAEARKTEGLGDYAPFHENLDVIEADLNARRTKAKESKEAPTSKQEHEVKSDEWAATPRSSSFSEDDRVGFDATIGSMVEAAADVPSGEAKQSYRDRTMRIRNALSDLSKEGAIGREVPGTELKIGDRVYWRDASNREFTGFIYAEGKSGENSVKVLLDQSHPNTGEATYSVVKTDAVVTDRSKLAAPVEPQTGSASGDAAAVGFPTRPTVPQATTAVIDTDIPQVTGPSRVVLTPQRRATLVQIVHGLLGDRSILVQKLRGTLKEVIRKTKDGAVVVIDPAKMRTNDEMDMVIAHVIGHADTLVPEEISKSNILGLIAKLKEHAAHTAGTEPSNASETLTVQDRIVIRRSAEKELAAITLNAQKDYKVLEDAAEQDWAQQHNGMAPNKNSQEWKRFHDATVPKWEDFKKQNVPDWKDFYEGKIRDEAERRNPPLMLKADIMKELVAVSEGLRGPIPTDAKSREYRMRAKELYADAVAALLMDSKFLEDTAPKFFSAFMKHLESRAEFKAEYIKTLELLNEEGALAKYMLQQTNAMWTDSENKLLQEAAKKPSGGNVIELAIRMLVDRHHSAGKLDAASTLTGLPWGEVHQALGELEYVDNPQHLYVKRIDDILASVQDKYDIPHKDLDTYFLLQRVIQGGRELKVLDEKGNVRLDDQGNEMTITMPNPKGIDRPMAEDMLKELRAQIEAGPGGAKAWKDLETAAHEFHQEVSKLMDQAVDAGVYNRKMVEDFKKDRVIDGTVMPGTSESYVTFAATKYLTDYVSAGMKAQLGTFEDIASPTWATTAKMTSLIKWIHVNKLSAAIIDSLPPEAYKRLPAAPGVEPRPADGMGVITVYVDGHPRYYEVDPYMAESTKHLPVGDMERIAKLWSHITVRPYHNLIVRYNPGYQIRNIPRDIQRTWINMASIGGVSFAKLMAEYRKAFPEAFKYIRTGESKAVESAIGEYAVSERRFAGDPLLHPVAQAKDSWSLMLVRHGMADRAGNPTPSLRNTVSKMLGVIPLFGEAHEIAIKMAAYEGLKAKGFKSAEAAEITRNYAGTPNLMKGGTAAPVMNAFVLYYRIATTGLAADLKVATTPKTAYGWWWRTLLTSVVPQAAMAAALAGKFGDDVKKKMEQIPDRDRAVYNCLPLPFDIEGDKAWYMRLPQNETQRIVGAVAHYAIQKKAPQALDMVASQIPGPNPIISMIMQWGDLARGMAPVNDFGSPIVSKDEMLVGGWKPAVTLAKSQGMSLGVISDVAKTAIDASKQALGKPVMSGEDPWWLKAMLDIPGAKALVMHSGAGTKEKLWEQAGEKERQSAIRREQRTEEQKQQAKQLSLLKRAGGGVNLTGNGGKIPTSNPGSYLGQLNLGGKKR